MESEKLLEVKNLKKYFPIKKGILGRNVKWLKAVDGITFSIDAGETFKHILPNALSPIIVAATLDVGWMIIAASGMSFLGLGAQPPMAEWGVMLSDGKDFLRVAPHISLLPGLAIFIVVLSLNLLGDGLRDALDPRLRE